MTNPAHTLICAGANWAAFCDAILRQYSNAKRVFIGELRDAFNGELLVYDNDSSWNGFLKAIGVSGLNATSQREVTALSELDDEHRRFVLRLKRSKPEHRAIWRRFQRTRNRKRLEGDLVFFKHFLETGSREIDDLECPHSDCQGDIGILVPGDFNCPHCGRLLEYP